MAKPFLKWAGGKRSLLPQLLALAPGRIETYYEPFLGGGALFFALEAEGRFQHAVLSDSNEELINAYIQVRDRVDDVIDALSVHQRKYDAASDRADYYYTIRAKRLTCDLGGAANLIFLNKTCFNGLYRVNSKGEFNVPHGRYTQPAICDEAILRATSQALQGAELHVSDFDVAELRAASGDFVYYDPPYVPLSDTANFTSYTAKEFGASEQRRLASSARTARRNGADVLLSNSAHPDVMRLYESEMFRLERVQASRAISARASGRGRTAEYLIQSR